MSYGFLLFSENTWSHRFIILLWGSLLEIIKPVDLS